MLVTVVTSLNRGRTALDADNKGQKARVKAGHQKTGGEQTGKQTKS